MTEQILFSFQSMIHESQILSLSILKQPIFVNNLQVVLMKISKQLELRQKDDIISDQYFVIILNDMNIEQYQAQIFQLNCDLQRISVLERKSRARLQVVHRHNKCFIRSINDKYKNIRILLLGLILNIQQTNNRQRLSKLKTIIYQSELQHLTASRGLLKEELHKNVGLNLEMTRLAENIQNELIKCFNCVAFFDEVLVSSFREYFLPNDFESFQIWHEIISKTFEIEIRITQGGMQEDNDVQDKRYDSFQLQRGSDCLYLPSNHKESFETDTIIDVSSMSIEEIDLQRRHNLMTVSIDSLQSPDISNKENINNRNTLEKSRKIPSFEPKVQLSRSRRTKKTSFWTFFCCSVD